jgi:hypothetical protein
MIIGNRFSGIETVGRVTQAAGYDTSYARYFPLDGGKECQELCFMNAMDITHLGEASPTFTSWASMETPRLEMYAMSVLTEFATIHVVNEPLYSIEQYIKNGTVLSEVEIASLQLNGWYPTDDPYLAAALYGYCNYLECHSMYRASAMRVKVLPSLLSELRIRRQLTHGLAHWLHIAPKEVDSFKVPTFGRRLTFQSLKRKSKQAHFYAKAHLEAINDYQNHL